MCSETDQAAYSAWWIPGSAADNFDRETGLHKITRAGWTPQNSAYEYLFNTELLSGSTTFLLMESYSRTFVQGSFNSHKSW